MGNPSCLTTVVILARTQQLFVAQQPSFEQLAAHTPLSQLSAVHPSRKVRFLAPCPASASFAPKRTGLRASRPGPHRVASVSRSCHLQNLKSQISCRRLRWMKIKQPVPRVVLCCSKAPAGRHHSAPRRDLPTAGEATGCGIADPTRGDTEIASPGRGRASPRHGKRRRMPWNAATSRPLVWAFLGAAG